MRPSPAPSRRIEAAIGPFDDFCDGYCDPGDSAAAYVTVLKLSTGLATANMDAALERIVSMDRAGANDAYVGQVNRLGGSSVSWLNGVIWGYDVARHDDLVDGTRHPLLRHERQDGSSIPVYSATPLLEAGQALFGTAEARRFPLMPGSYVLCAEKDVVADGPVEIWSAIALAIAVDRSVNASLFVKDAGQGARDESRHEQAGLLHEFRRIQDLVNSVVLCGDDQGVTFQEIFVGYKAAWVPEGRVGCALSCVPCLVLAKNAVPQPAAELLSMSLSDWETFVAPHLKERGSQR